jgi:hypothetical protein
MDVFGIIIANVNVRQYLGRIGDSGSKKLLAMSNAMLDCVGSFQSSAGVSLLCGNASCGITENWNGGYCALLTNRLSRDRR